MAQYQIGSVQVAYGSNQVDAVDPSVADGVLAETLWLSEVTAGDLFYIRGDSVAYTVASVSSNTTLVLTGTYQGETVTPAGDPYLEGARYAVHRDFSTNYNMPMPNKGDFGMPIFLQRAITIMDTTMKGLNDRIAILEP